MENCELILEKDWFVTRFTRFTYRIDGITQARGES